MSTLLDVPPHHRDDDSGQAAAMYDALKERITEGAVREWLLDLCDEVARWAGIEIDDPLDHLPAAQEILKSVVIKEIVDGARLHLIRAKFALDELSEEYDATEIEEAQEEIQTADTILVTGEL